MTQASSGTTDPRAIARAAVRNPANAGTIVALTDLLWAMHRSRLTYQQGAPALALLVHLAKGGPMRSSDLAAGMHLAVSTVSRHLTHLEADGLVARAPDLGDGRAHLVEVTPAGRHKAHSLIASRVHELETVIDTWSVADREDLARLLTRFTDDFDAHVADAVSRSTSPAHPNTTTEDSP